MRARVTSQGGLLLAFAVGCATAFVCARVVSPVRAQGSGGTVHACAAADGVLRLTTGSCPAGQRSFSFATAGASPASGQADAAPVEARRPTLADLEQRVRVLESRDGGSVAKKVVAPFQVIDGKGAPIFSVDQTGMLVYGAGGRTAVQIERTDVGAILTVFSASAGRSVRLGAGSLDVGLRVIEGNYARIDVGRDAAQGNYRLRVVSPTGQFLAGVGQAAGGMTGVAAIADTQGMMRANMWVRGGKSGVFNVRGPSEDIIAELTEGANNEGLLRLFSKSGEEMVEAGGTAEGVGVVRVGPEAFKPGYGVLGLPGSYIAGKR